MTNQPPVPEDKLYKILKDYRSKVADVTQHYWEIIGTGADTGVTTELLNKLDDEAATLITKLLVEAKENGYHKGCANQFAKDKGDKSNVN